MKKIIKGFAITITALSFLFLAFVYFANYHPNEIEPEEVVCPSDTSVLQAGQDIKILNWNVQYMASKNYTFFYDVLDGSGRDMRPSAEHIAVTLDEVARVIRDENPDVILIQELDEGSRRTDYDDQLALLLNRLPQQYRCYADSFYHKSRFVPHPMIMGSVGMKLATISKYRIGKAIRHQLALIPSNIIMQQFNLKRAILEVQMPMDNGQNFYVFNTHLDAFSQGTNTMEMQVAEATALLKQKNTQGKPWIIGGDFNLLPPGGYERLAVVERAYYKQDTELKKLFDLFRVIPSPADLSGENYTDWYTHYPNGKRAQGPDRTIDYIFYSDSLRANNYYVRQKDTLQISDHLPLAAFFTLPK